MESVRFDKSREITVKGLEVSIPVIDDKGKQSTFVINANELEENLETVNLLFQFDSDVKQ